MLTDMKMTEAEKKATSPMPSTQYKGPDYPYGLKICLDAAALKKLGIDMLMVGTKVEIEGVGTVVECSMNDYEYGESSKRVEIQLQQLAVVPDSETEDKAEMKLNRSMGRRTTALADD